MKIYLIRHADAVDAGEGGVKEAERYLTVKGRADMRRVAEKLAALGVNFDGVLTSPLVRAVQTAEIVAVALGFSGLVEVCRALEAGRWKPRSIAKVLTNRSLSGSYALVGHNPDMEEIASALLNVPEGAVPFQKGAVCLIEVDGAPFSGEARFRWMLQPKGLRLVRDLGKLKE